MPCYSPLKGWKDRDTGGITWRPENGLSEMEVACGQCLGCRLDHSRMWAMRIVHESDLPEHNGNSWFVTLTYRDRYQCDDEQFGRGLYIPDDWSLNKKHVQLFLKRLRRNFPKNKIRFFVAGEYGRICRHGLDLDNVECSFCNLGRPHYHICIFGLPLNDMERYGIRDGHEQWTSGTVEKIWGFGNIDVQELNFDSAAYVSRYSLKKVNGARAEEHYMVWDNDGVAYWLQPEFINMSRRPGIGKAWFDKYREDVFPSDEVPVPGMGVLRGVPRYYEEIFKEENPLSMEEIKAVRQKWREEHGNDYTPERLMDRYKVAKAKQELFGGKKL